MSSPIMEWPRISRGDNEGSPRIRLQSELIDWWCLRITASKSELERWESADASSLHARTDYIEHYAMELGRIIRDTKGRARLVLLNGDSYSGAGGWGTSTSQHQSSLRSSVEAAVEGTDIEVLVVPFSALGAAGIAFDSIRVVEALPDRYTRHEISSPERPGNFVLKESGETEMVPYSVAHPYRTHGYQVDGKRTPASEGGTYGEITELVERPVMVPDETRAHVDKSGMAHAWADGYAKLQSDGTWTWTVKRHWLGESLFKGTVTETRRRKLTADEQAQVDAWNAARAPEREASRTLTNLIDRRASLNWKRRRLENGNLAFGLPLYGLPEPEVELEAKLEPQIDAAREAYRAREIELAKHSLPDGYSSGQIVYYVKRTSYYLSAFDYSEPHRPYFMCELPRSIVKDGQRVQVKPKTVEEALDDLMPDEVRQAIASGLEVIRQGDVFAIPTSCTTKELESRAVGLLKGLLSEARVYNIRSKTRDGQKAAVLGTNHAPTHAILTKDGDWYGRGRMYHVPRQSWRQPDHRVKELGDRKTWFRLVKNTVPLDKASGSSRGSTSATVFQSGDSRAWTVGGDVD